MTLLWIVALCILIAIALVSVLNTLTFPRLRPTSPRATDFVSILIPARDEADVIADTVSRLMGQSYPHFELIVLDDGSADGTRKLAHEAAAGDTRLKVLAGQPPPSGWTGKNWACQQLARQAQGDRLVFTDADVRWEPDALAALVNLMDETGADTLTVWPTQETESWAERLVVPLMALSIMTYLPELGVRSTPWPALAAANGQCLAFRREAYTQIGGHAAVRGNIVEDIGLARETKRRGLRMVMADGNRLIGGRMYESWSEVRDGFAKNILAGHGGQPAFLLSSTVFHWLIFLAPWVWLALGWAIELGPLWPWFPLALVGLGLGARALSAVATHQRPVDALGMPASTVLMTIIAARSLWWQFRFGGARWKGRTVEHRV